MRRAVLCLSITLGCAQPYRDPAPAPAESGRLLDCNTVIATRSEFHDGYVEVLGVVALAPAQDLGAPLRADGRYFVKSGLYVRPGARFELVVPESAAFDILWGNNDEPTKRLRVPGCSSQSNDWLVFAGGFFVREKGCFPLIVRTEEREQSVDVALGVSCESE